MFILNFYVSIRIFFSNQNSFLAVRTERLFEDHELLVDNLMNWSNDSKNRVLFLQRNDKVALFNTPEKFLNGTQMAPGNDHDEHTRFV